jgi:hypothetical protein
MQGRLQAVAVKATRRRPPRIPRLSRLREHRWSPAERAVVILVVAIVMGSLFVTAYSLALGDPIPHRIQVAVVGDSTGHTSTVDALEGVARGTLVLQRYPSVPAALHAIDEQQLCVALDLTSQPPTLYLSSAAGVSVARVLEGISTVDPTVRVVDTHPLPASDPNGLKIFYLMLVATIAGFLTTFQVRANAGGLSLRQWTVFVLALAVTASLAFTLVEGPLLGLLDLPVLESWGVLALQLLAVASFASLMAVLIGRWAILPTFVFFVILGNTSSGGAVAPPLLPPPLAFVSQARPPVLDHAALLQLGQTPESTAMSKDLRRRGWSFVGPTTVYAFMQAMGLVNDHLEGCDRRAPTERERHRFRRPSVVGADGTHQSGTADGRS